MTTIIDKRVVNALFPEAKPRSMFPLGWLILYQAKWMFGGLWVGGEAILYDDKFVFEPNAMNKAAHADPENLGVSIPITDILSALWRKASITDIIEIRTRDKIFSIRCYHARSFAERIQSQISSAKS